MDKCKTCGIPETRTHLCDRWDCPLLVACRPVLKKLNKTIVESDGAEDYMCSMLAFELID